MPEKSLYILAEFDDATQRILADYYAALTARGFIGTQTKDIPYHFTMGQYPVESEWQVTDRLNSICADMRAVDVRFDHIGLFGMNVLFLAPAMSHELLDMQQSLAGSGAVDAFPWTAHATILIDEPEVIAHALPVITEVVKPFSAKIDSIGLYEFFPKRFINKYELQ